VVNRVGSRERDGQHLSAYGERVDGNGSIERVHRGGQETVVFGKQREIFEGLPSSLRRRIEDY